MRRELLLQRMKEENLQTGAVAKGIKVRITSLSDLLHNPSATPGTSMAVKLCAFLGLPMQDLFQDEIDAFQDSLPALLSLAMPIIGRSITRNASRPVLLKAMEEKGIPAATLASFCGVTRTYISVILNTPRALSLKMGIKFAAILGITLDDIFREDLDRAPSTARIAATRKGLGPKDGIPPASGL